MDCLNVIWNSLCKPSGFKAVEASAKHYLSATREAPKIISRALQELHSQKKPGCRYVCWLGSLKRERWATRDLKGPKIWLTLCKKSFALFVYRPVVSIELHRASWITSARRIKPLRISVYQNNLINVGRQREKWKKQALLSLSCDHK